MLKKYFLITLLLTIIGGIAVYQVYACNFSQGQNKPKGEVKIEVKKIDKGVNLIITSENPEKIKELQNNKEWFNKSLLTGKCSKHSFACQQESKNANCCKKGQVDDSKMPVGMHERMQGGCMNQSSDK